MIFTYTDKKFYDYILFMNENKKVDISEIRVEEVVDSEENQHFYRVYFYYADGRIEIMGESLIKPILARYTSKVY